MPNIAAVLKEEIARVAKKTGKGELEALRKTVQSLRSQVAQLKRRTESLEKQVKRASGRPAKNVQQEAPESGGRKLRFSAERLAAQRKKLGLSAADFGALIGASALSVYKWEKGEVRPRQKHLTAIAAARALGKREAAKRLEELRS